MSLIPRSVSVRFTALMGGFTGPLTAAGRSVNAFGRGIGGAVNTISSLGTRMNAISGQIQTLQRRIADAPRGISPAQRQAMRDELRGLQDQHAALARQRQAFSNLGRTATVAGVAMVAGFGFAVKAAADFDKAMSKVAAVSNASGKELGALRKAAIDAGRDTKYSATQAAEAESELAKAGISSANILGGALKGSLALAAAGEIGLADAATVSAQAMHIFNLEGKDVTHVADVLAAGANKSAGDVKGLAWSLRMGGQVAAQTGLSLESTVGVLSAFADNALIGSDAGTSLKTMLQRLANPTDKMSATMEDLGIQVYDVNGNFVGMEKFAQQLQVGLGGLTQQQRDQAIATLGGADAARGINILYKIGAQGVKQYTDAVNDNGAAQRTSAKLMDNLSGDLENLKGSLETALIQSGSGANSVLREMVQAANGVAHAFLALPSGIQSSVVVIIGITGAVILLSKALFFLVTTVEDAKVALVALGVTGPRVAAAMTAVRAALASTASFLAGPWGLAIGAAVAILGLWWVAKKKATQATDEYVAAIKADSGALAENTRESVANALEKNGLLKAAQSLNLTEKQITDAVLGEGNAYRETLGHLKDYLDALQKRKSFAQEHGGPDFDNEGALNDEIAATKKLINGLEDQHGSLEKSAESYKRVQAATKGATTETKNMTAAQVAAAAKTEDNVSAEQKLIDVMESSSSKASELKQAFDDLSGGFISNTEAAIKQREAVKSAADESDHRAGLSDKETTALINIAKANQDVLVSMKGSEVEGDKIVEKQHSMTAAFIKTAMGMGATRKEATDLARNMGLFVKVAESSTVSLDGWINKVANAAGAARHLAQRTGGDAKNAQEAFRASVERSLPVLYAMAGSNARLRGQVDALARSAGATTGKMNVSRSSFISAASAMNIGAREAAKLWTKLQALKSRNISVNIDAKGQWKAFNNGVAVPGSERPGFALGGRVPMVRGGSRSHDSVDAVLRVDEHVLTPEEVDAMGGHAAVYRLRRAALAGQIQGFANGGRVGGAKLTSDGAADRIITPVYKGYQTMLNDIVRTMAKEFKKAMSGGGIVAAARSMIGLPYSWGGGGIGGPSYGIGRGAGTYGFDCSGLTEYAWWKGRHIDIGGTTDPQSAGSHAIGGPRPGALGFVGNPIHHVMLASDRPGYVIQAPFTGSFVQEVQRSSSNWRWPNAAGKAKGGPVTRAEMEAGKRFITTSGGNEDPALFGLAGDPGMVRGFAEGGWILGPSGSDRVLLRGTAGEFVVAPGPAKANAEMLEALNVGRVTSAKLVPEVSTSGPLTEGVQTSTITGPGKLKIGGNFSNPKPRPIGSLLEEAHTSKTINPKSTGTSGTISDGSAEISSFVKDLAAAGHQVNTFGASVFRSHQWVDAFSTSMVNAVRRIDAFSGSGSGTTYQITIENNGVIGSKSEVDKWFAATVERLRRQGKIP